MVSGTRCPFIAIINASLEAKYQNVAVVTIARGSLSQMPTWSMPLYPSVKQHSGPATDEYPGMSSKYIIKE
jgi:hypothetical protein